jgi:hypothetical protein
MPSSTDDAPPPEALSRRAFLRIGSASLAVLAMPGCKAGDLTGLGQDAENLVVSEWITVQRGDDLVNLQVGLANLVRDATGTKLVRAQAGAPALLVLQFPPQHVCEAAVFQGETPYTPTQLDLAAESRVVLAVPDSVLELPFDVAGLLRALSDLGMNVSANAAPAPGLQGGAGGTVSGAPGAPRPPALLETALELPWRLLLSPNQHGRWHNAAVPVAARGRTELWHTRLGVIDAQGVRSERASPLRTVRALWTRDRDPGQLDNGINGSLTASDRDQLVTRTSGTGAEPIAIDRLMLSSLGGWLDARAHFASGTLARWIHRASMGRDAYVEVAYRGAAYPTCHKFLIVKISERRLDAPTGGWAHLWQRFLIVPTERTCAYGADVDRRMPLATMTIIGEPLLIDPPPWLPLPHDPPDARHGQPAPFVPSHDRQPVRFAIEAVDRDGNRLRFDTPIVWAPVDPRAPLAQLEQLYRAVEPRTNLANQRLWLAPASAAAHPGEPDRPGDTTFAVTTMMLTAAPVAAAADEAWFAPYLGELALAIPALRQLAGADAVRAFTYSEAYRTAGFEGANPRQLLLELTAPSDPIRLNLTAQADAVGGFVAPNLDIKGLSRLAGPISDVANQPDILPADLFPQAGGLGGLLDAKLFGCFALKDIIGTALPGGAGDFAKQAPKFVTDALHEVERYQRMVGDVIKRVTDATAEGLGGQLDKLGALAEGEIDRRLSAVRGAVQAEIDRLKKRLIDALDPGAPTLLKKAEAVIAALLKLPAAVTADDQTRQQAKQQFDTAVAAWTGDLTGIAGDLTSSKYLPYAYPFIPGLEVMIRDFAGLLQRIAAVSADVGTAIDSFLRGVELLKSQQLTLDWRPPVRSWIPTLGNTTWTYPVFEIRTGGGLTLAAVIRGKPQGEAKAGVDLLCSLDKFSLVLGTPDAQFVRLNVDKFQFRRRSGRKPEIDVVFAPKNQGGMLEFKGPLSFVQTIKDALPLDGFSDPPDVQIKPTGLVASFSQGLPSVSAGIFSLENMAISASLDVPFIGDAMRFRFAFASREKPFLVGVAMLGGTGFFAIDVAADGLVGVEAQLEFGAHLAIDLGVASGGVTMMGGLYFRLLEGAVMLRGFLRIRGEVDVLGLISASIELSLQLAYDSSSGDVTGRATLEIEVSIGFFSTGVHLECERRFAGAGHPGAATSAMAMPVPLPLPAPTSPTFADLMPAGSGAWEQYCAAFAPLAVVPGPDPITPPTSDF